MLKDVKSSKSFPSPDWGSRYLQLLLNITKKPDT